MRSITKQGVTDYFLLESQNTTATSVYVQELSLYHGMLQGLSFVIEFVPLWASLLLTITCRVLYSYGNKVL